MNRVGFERAGAVSSISGETKEKTRGEQKNAPAPTSQENCCSMQTSERDPVVRWAVAVCRGIRDALGTCLPGRVARSRLERVRDEMVQAARAQLVANGCNPSLAAQLIERWGGTGAGGRGAVTLRLTASARVANEWTADVERRVRLVRKAGGRWDVAEL